MYAFLHVHICASVYVCICLDIGAYQTYSHIYIYIIHISMCVYAYSYMFINMYVYIFYLASTLGVVYPDRPSSATLSSRRWMRTKEELQKPRERGPDGEETGQPYTVGASCSIITMQYYGSTLLK